MKTIKLKDILAISGKGGLFRFVAQARNGIVVESLEDKKRHVAPATARVSSLEDIAIFTYEEEVPLADIFYQIYQEKDEKEVPSHKSSADELKKRFLELVPEYDEERVYSSDIKKVFQWYRQLEEKDLLEVFDKEEDGESEPSEKDPEEPSAKDKEGPSAKGQAEPSVKDTEDSSEDKGN